MSAIIGDWHGNPRTMREELEAKTGLSVDCLMRDAPDETRVIVCFVIIPGPNRPWSKPFALSPSLATPQAFIAMLDEWRKEVSRKIDACETDGILSAVLAEYDEPTVRRALDFRISPSDIGGTIH